MQDISKGEGRTVLFVSHNMVAVQNLCSRVINLENGLITKDGKPSDVIGAYLKNQQELPKLTYKNDNVLNEVGLKSFKIISAIQTGKPFEFEAVVYSKIITVAQLALTFSSVESQPIYQIYSGHVGVNFKLKEGDNIIKGYVKKMPLVHDIYEANLWIGTSALTYEMCRKFINIEIGEGAISVNGPISSKNGYPIIEDAKWEIK
jgi:lipopolysaccharide transport system ATP-binding protein